MWFFTMAGDPDRMNRFEREAKTLAALNHPNVVAIYGLEEQAGRKYLILEYVDGDTLADQLRKKRLPLEELMAICAKIAAGVAAAHDAGIIHRDLKPANIKVTPNDDVKVLDFGLAKPMATTAEVDAAGQGPGSGQPAAPMSPIQTMAGVIVGTAA